MKKKEERKKNTPRQCRVFIFRRSSLNMHADFFFSLSVITYMYAASASLSLCNYTIHNHLLSPLLPSVCSSNARQHTHTHKPSSTSFFFFFLSAILSLSPDCFSVDKLCVCVFILLSLYIPTTAPPTRQAREREKAKIKNNKMSFSHLLFMRSLL